MAWKEGNLLKKNTLSMERTPLKVGSEMQIVAKFFECSVGPSPVGIGRALPSKGDVFMIIYVDY